MIVRATGNSSRRSNRTAACSRDFQEKGRHVDCGSISLRSVSPVLYQRMIPDLQNSRRTGLDLIRLGRACEVRGHGETGSTITVVRGNGHGIRRSRRHTAC